MRIPPPPYRCLYPSPYPITPDSQPGGVHYTCFKLLGLNLDLTSYLCYTSRPIDGSDLNAISHSSQEIISRLGRIEQILSNFSPPSWGGSEHGQSQAVVGGTPHSSVAVPSPVSSRHNHSVVTREDLLVGQSFKGLARLAEQPVPTALLPLAQQDGEDWLKVQIHRGEDLFLGPPADLRSQDLSNKTCWRLQQSFASLILPWCPLIDQQESAHIVTCTSEQKFPDTALETCLTLFIFALGAIAKEDYRGDTASEFAGLSYFQLASTMLSHPRHTNHSILAVQCRILQSFYYLFTLRHLQAFDSIHIAALATLNLLEFEARLKADDKFRQHVYRAYWACYLTEHELQARVSYSSCLLQLENELVPLPSFDHDEPGSYWFLSEIAFRKIFSNSREGYGWNSFSIHKYAVIQEIDLQLQQWYDYLPAKVKFPVELTHLIDPQKVFLRAQYYAIVGVLHWSAVVWLLTSPPPTDAKEAAVLVDAAARCLEYLITHVHAVESLLQERHLMLHANITGLHCIAFLLVCTYNAPELAGIQRPDHGDAVRKARVLLSNWRACPIVEKFMVELEELMVGKGLLGDQAGVVAGSGSGSGSRKASGGWGSPELRFKAS